MEVGSSTLPGTTTHGREAMCTGSNAAWDYFEGGLAQLARAPALQAGGQRFESVILHRGFCKDCTNEVSDNPITRDEETKRG